jgi:hypothetical protein
MAALAGLAAVATSCGDTGAPPIDSGPLYACATETRAVAYVPNLSRTSATGTYTAVLVMADPAPPAKGNNSWTVEIRDASQAPVDGLTITGAANMPDHGHPPSVKPVVKATGAPGQYSVMPLDFFMAGYWEVTLTFQPPGGAKESIVFNICIAG